MVRFVALAGVAGLTLAACVAPGPQDSGMTPTTPPAVAQGLGALSFSTSNGTVSPDYRWDLDFTIDAAGQGVLRRCTGYATEGDACRSHSFAVPQARRDAIAAAVRSGDLLQRQARPIPMPPIGGGATAATLTVDGQQVVLPPWPIQADSERVGAVRRAIRDAIPATAHAAVGHTD